MSKNKTKNESNDSPEPEIWPIEKIVPYERNAKVHSQESIKELANIIAAQGFRSFIRVDKHGVIIAGHRRRLAALSLGMKFLPVVVDAHLNEEQVKAARLSDNRVSDNSQYDTELMQSELEELNNLGFDMSLTAFDSKELEFLTDSLDDMNVDALIDDLDTEVTKQTERVEKKVEEVEKTEVSVGEALGFKKVTVEQSRTIGQFMRQLSEETSEEGADAFVAFISPLVSEG